METPYDTVAEIRPIYDQPDHKLYGPVRRAHMMLEQLFADQFGGLKGFMAKLATYRESVGSKPLRWDEHLAWLIRKGYSEPEAQRTIITQMITALEMLS